MNHRKIILTTLLIASLASPRFAFGREDDNKPNILATAAAAGSFKTLGAAIQAAGLTDALNGDGPFTVFAPTDAAFAKLPAGTVESLLLPENKAKLQAILKYHVVSGKVMAKDAIAAKSAPTLEGGKIRITEKYGNVLINDSKVVKADIVAGNGVIHVIDTVLLPGAPSASMDAAKPKILGIAVAAGKFNTLAAAIQAAGLTDALNGDGPFTVFAPTDAAFAKLPAGTVESLLLPENKAKLQAILKYHVVSGQVMAKDAIAAKSAATLQGEEIRITQDDGTVMINDSKVVKADITASNGVIHVIDTVLLPSGK